jgi:hypothetical protein
MKILMLALFFLSFSVQASYRVVKVCDENYNCQYVKIYDNQNNQNNQSNDALINQIVNSGANNTKTITDGWLKPQY